jgi:hypothetical protein
MSTDVSKECTATIFRIFWQMSADVLEESSVSNFTDKERVKT